MYERHHPWRVPRDQMLEWHVEFVTLQDGVAGETDHDRKVISIDRNLGQRDRRSTLTYEALHVGREHLGDDHHDADVEQMAARILMPLDQLLEVPVWARGSHEAAEELWVDHALFLARMNHLHPSEAAATRRVNAARDFWETA